MNDNQILIGLHWPHVFPRIFLGGSFLLLAIIMLVLFLFSRRERRYLLLTWLGLCMSFWTWSHLPKALAGIVVPEFLQKETVMYYAAIMAPIPMLLFCKQTFGSKWKRRYACLILAHVVLLVLTVIARPLEILSWAQINIFLNILVVLSGGIMLINALAQARIGNYKARIFLIGLAFLAALLVIDAVVFSFGGWLIQQGIAVPQAPITHYGVFAVYLAQIAVIGIEQKKLRQTTEEYAVSLEKMLVEVQAKQRLENLAHDLKVPIAVIEVALAGQAWVGSNEKRADVASALLRMRSIVDGLKGGGQDSIVSPEPTPMNFTEISENIIAALSPDVELFVTGNALLCHAYVDRPKLERAIENLLTNAVESGATVIDVNVSAADEALVIVVSDNGPGVPEEVRGQLFERGFSFNKADGKGYGLDIVKTIVRGHGGRVDYDRSNDKTNFIVHLPRAIFLDEVVSAVETRSEVVAGGTAPLQSVLICIKDLARAEAIERALMSNHPIKVMTAIGRESASSLVYTDDQVLMKHCMEQGISVMVANSGEDVENVTKNLLLRIRASSRKLM